MARLGKVVKDLNIGKQRAVDFLEKKGCPIDDDINAKLTDEQYTLLLKEFSSDKVLKEQTEKRQAERQAKKQKDAEERRKARRGDEIEERIHMLEGRIADIEEAISDPERASDFEWMHEQSAAMAECEEEITRLYDEWMELQ